MGRQIVIVLNPSDPDISGPPPLVGGGINILFYNSKTI